VSESKPIVIGEMSFSSKNEAEKYVEGLLRKMAGERGLLVLKDNTPFLCHLILRAYKGRNGDTWITRIWTEGSISRGRSLWVSFNHEKGQKVSIRKCIDGGE
jgi:hypothetical protein